MSARRMVIGVTGRLPWAGALAALLLVASTAEAQDLGRLFFTAEERAILDDARRDMDVGPRRPAGGGDERPARQPTELTFGGSVVRGNGETTTWINGQPVLPGDATREGIRVTPTGRPGGEVRVTLPSGVGSIELRPGQRIEVVSGRVVDAYEIGQLEKRPSGESDIELEGGASQVPPDAAGSPSAPAPGRPPAAAPTAGGS